MTAADPLPVGGGRASRSELAAVFAGGGLGALVRTGLAEGWSAGAGALPWATLVANVAGCLALGVVVVRTDAGSARRGLLGAGLCGGLTTFSAFQLELVELLRDGRAPLALAYAAVSLALGLLAYAAGRRLA